MIIVIANFENENFISWQIYVNKNEHYKFKSLALFISFKVNILNYLKNLLVFKC